MKDRTAIVLCIALGAFFWWNILVVDIRVKPSHVGNADWLHNIANTIRYRYWMFYSNFILG